QKKLIMLPSETMIWQPEFTDKTLSRKPGAVQLALRGDMLSSAGVNGNRCSQAIAYLDEIMNARQPIIVSTEHKTFDNMILTGIDYEYKTESALQFDLQFEQIRLVSYATTNAIAVKTASPKSTGGQVKSRVPTNAGTASTTKDTLPTYDGEVK
ncbi:phage baseplate protein, partial [Escherichia coli]|uniref:phage baseplate protein n=3 Tax=Escherichia coli TaxID=562 RepID=UPI00320903B6